MIRAQYPPHLNSLGRGAHLVLMESVDPKDIVGSLAPKGRLETQASWVPRDRRACQESVAHLEHQVTVEMSGRVGTKVSRAFKGVRAAPVPLGSLECRGAV